MNPVIESCDYLVSTPSDISTRKEEVRAPFRCWLLLDGIQATFGVHIFLQ